MAAMLLLAALPCAVLAQSQAAKPAATNCSGAESPGMFRACLDAHAHAKATGQPAIAKPKPPTQGPGYGVKPRQISPKVG
jgi:uncharacterized protein involved in copper resistance